MNKLDLCFLVVLSLLCFSCELGKSVSEKIDGQWAFDYEKSWEYKNPGKKYGEDEKQTSETIGLITMVIDTKEKTITTNIQGFSPSIQRYSVLQDDKKNVTLSTNNGTRTIEFFSENIILMCSKKDSSEKCGIYTRVRH